MQANFLSRLFVINIIILGISVLSSKVIGQNSSDQLPIPSSSLQFPPQEPDVFSSPSWEEANEVVLQGLDKITARVFTVTAKINQLVKFGTLDIYVRKGYKAPPEETPESVCFLEISERKAGETAKLIFSGWMFASNPSLYPLEHPIYDVWVKEIKTSHQEAIVTSKNSESKNQKNTQYPADDSPLSSELIEDGF